MKSNQLKVIWFFTFTRTFVLTNLNIYELIDLNRGSISSSKGVN
jgi:hypothetical protein